MNRSLRSSIPFKNLSTVASQDVLDYTVVGGGIVGLATMHELCKRHPRARTTVLEKEPHLAMHQSTHNSGKIE